MLNRLSSGFAWLKIGVFVAALGPFAYMVWGLLTGQLGVNPIDSLTDQTGDWAIRFLLLSLAASPLRHLLSRTWPLKFRRMLGLFAFFYALLHVLIWSVLDQQLSVPAMWDDLLKRPYILAGFTAFIILLPLALTSTQWMVRRLKTRWMTLHRWVYIAGAAAIVHYTWLVKGFQIEPLVYLGILAVLYVLRFKRLLGAR